MRRKYTDGSILKHTRKALRKHPNHFDATDRFRVTGPTTAEWFKSEDWRDPISGQLFKAGEVIQRDTRVVHDCFVELA